MSEIRVSIRIALGVSAALIFATAAPGARQAPPAQQPPAPQQPAPAPTFRATANFVEVDASVLDRNRQPVRGLMASDFTVLEDGEPQPVVTFKEIYIPDPVEPPVAWMRDVPPDVKSNVAAAEGRLIALILEDGMVGLDIFEKQVKTIGRHIVDQMGPGDLLAIIFPRDIKKSSDFTSDRRFLLSVVDKYAAGHSGEMGNRSLIEAIVKVSELLADAPQRRKSLIYVSPGWPVDLVTFGSGNPFRAILQLRMEEAFDQARRSNVNVYSVDPTGLTDEAVAGSASVTSDGEIIRLTPQAASAGPSRSRTLGHDFLQTLAANTGGRAIVNNNEFRPGIAEIFRENSSYYLLGYRSPNNRLDGKFRRIDVRVDRPGVTVRARSGYNGGKPADATAVPPTPIVRALSGILPSSDIAMQAALAPFALPGGKGKEAAVAVTLAVRQPAPTDASITSETIRLAVTAYNALGERQGSQWYNATLKLRPGVADQLQYEVRTHIALKPGRYQLRLAAESALLGKGGSLYYEVEVPDFTKPALSLSGVVVNATPAVASPANANMAAIVPVASTTRRQFSATDRVTTFMRVYQGGGKPLAPVTVTSRVFDMQGDVVFTESRTIAPAEFGEVRAVDHKVDVPIALLPPGPYVLTIEASAPRTLDARRDVRFEVR